MIKAFQNSSGVTTLISQTTEITGDLHFSGALEIEGKIFGNIYADSDSSAQVRLRDTGLVKGSIQAPLIIINGIVEGDVHASKHLELAAKGRVNGNVHYHQIEMVRGSEVNGSMTQLPPGDMAPRQLAAASSAAVAGEAVDTEGTESSKTEEAGRGARRKP